MADAVDQLKTLPRADAHFRGDVEMGYLDGAVDVVKEFSRAGK